MSKKSKKRVIIIGILLVIALAYATYLSISKPNEDRPDNINAVATVYEKDPATGEFNEWNGQALGQANPFSIPGGLSVILPEGEFYVTVDADNYQSVTSLITRVNQQSIVTADIALEKSNWLIIRKIISVFSTKRLNNFPLNVTPLPEEGLLEIGQVLPEINATDKDGRAVTFMRELGDKPNIILVFNYWNTEAQEQPEIYTKIVDELETEYNFIALYTLEPPNLNESYIDRGEYEFEVYKPNLQFFDDYLITSLPQFYVTNIKGELLGTITGSYSAEDLIGMINDIGGN